MEKITQITHYVLVKSVSPLNKYFYIRCETEGLNTHSWFIGYKNSLALVSRVGGDLSDELCKKLEEEYQNNLK
jgi:hypothetical protein